MCPFESYKVIILTFVAISQPWPYSHILTRYNICMYDNEDLLNIVFTTNCATHIHIHAFCGTIGLSCYASEADNKDQLGLH